MHDELTSPGPRPALLRALAGAGLLWGLSLLLPMKLEVGGAVWLPDVWATGSGRIAVAASLFSMVTLFVLSSSGGVISRSSRALCAITASAVGLAGLLADPDSQANLLPFLPTALSRGYVALAVALAAAAAGLRAAVHSRARVLFGIAALASAYLYLWPHPFGALSSQASDHLRAALRETAPLALGASTTQTVLSGLPGALVVLAAAVRWRARPHTSRLVAVWVITTMPAVLLALGVKSAAIQGADSQVLIGLRAAVLLLALVLVLAFGAEAFRAYSPNPGSLRQRMAAHGLTLAALGLTLSPHLGEQPREAWRVGPSPRWATQLYTHGLPRLAIAAGEVDLPGGQAVLRDAVEDAVRAAQPVPRLAHALRELGSLAKDPGPNHRRLERLADTINDAARAATLPLFVDLQVAAQRQESGYLVWTLGLKTYRIEEVHRYSIAGQQRSSLWLSRLDQTNAQDSQLGWTRHDAPMGIVMLNVVQAHWRQDLAPALTGASAHDPRTQTYARHAHALNADLVRALSGEVPPDAVAQLLECAAQRHRGRSSPACESVQQRIEPKVVRVLAQKVETHELRHATDGSRLAPPQALLKAMPGYAEQSVHFASAELSAYLAEIAHSRVPRIALAHFLALTEAHPQSPEGFAGRVAFGVLKDHTGLSAHGLIERPASEVAAAAEAAYTELFGTTLAPAEALDPIEGPLPSAPPPSV